MLGGTSDEATPFFYIVPDSFPAMYEGPAELEFPNVPISLIILFLK